MLFSTQKLASYGSQRTLNSAPRLAAKIQNIQICSQTALFMPRKQSYINTEVILLHQLKWVWLFSQGSQEILYCFMLGFTLFVLELMFLKDKKMEYCLLSLHIILDQVSNPKFPWHNLRAFPIVLSLVTWEERLIPISLHPPFMSL